MRTMRTIRTLLGPTLLLVAATAAAQQPMIDPLQASGLPLPDPQQPAGTITVRVLRGDFAHPQVGHEVTLQGPDGPRTAKTDETAHAVFSGLQAGASYVAKVSGFGEELASQPLEISAQSGIRVMLVFHPDEKALLGQADGVARADDKLPAGTIAAKVVDGDDKALGHLDVKLERIVTGGEPAVEKQATTGDDGVARFDGLPATASETLQVSVARDGNVERSKPFAVKAGPGALVALRILATTRDPKALSFGRQSHFVVEVHDEEVQVMENLVLVNASASPFDPGPAGLTLPLPDGAREPQLSPDGPKQLGVAGGQLVWKGLVPSGENNVAVMFALPTSGAAVALHQKMTVDLDGQAMIVEHLPGLEVKGDGLTQEERPMSGRTFWLVRGPGVKAGGAIDLRIAGLPQASTLARDLAAALAALIALWGLVRAWSRNAPATPRAKLEEKRDELLGKLAALDGAADAAKVARQRDELMARLERLYRELDESAA